MKLWGQSVFSVFCAAILLSGAFLLNLGSAYAPTNGDEMVYLHIARMTAESGHWLPVQSQLDHMRNTKPPFLFWQAMAVGRFGWDLFILRLPYVLETLACAVVVGYVARVTPQRVGRQVVAVPLLAAVLYLGFFSTYRYGRPVLTSSIESFFLFGLCACVIARLSFWQNRPVWLALVAGSLMAPALLAKSFVLAAPVGLWLFMALLTIRQEQEHRLTIKGLWRSAWPAALAVLMGVAIFAMWFVFDPDPASVWREFIVGENFSTKFKTDSYWMGAVKGADSMWGLWLSPLVNAGLLFPLVIGLWMAVWRVMRNQSSKLSLEEKLLWLWIFAWLFVFMWPNQRSGRYVIPVMPAFAVLLALYAGRIHRVFWVLTLCLIGIATAALAWVAWCLNGALPVGFGYSEFYFFTAAALLALCALGAFVARARAAATAITALVWLVLLGALSVPFDQNAGRFEARLVPKLLPQLAGQKILVPQNFNAQFERFQFVFPAMPRVQPVPYADSQNVTADQLLAQAPYAIVLQPLHPAQTSPGCHSCEVLSSRLVLRSRQSASRVTWQSLTNPEKLQDLLIDREVLVRRKKRVTVEAQ